MPGHEPIEHTLLRNAVIAQVTVTKTDVSPTSTGDRHVRIEGRLGNDDEEDVEWAAVGFIYAIGVLSFAGARPRGVSGMYFASSTTSGQPPISYATFGTSTGGWCARREYVRGRMMKTTVAVFPDGRSRSRRWIGVKRRAAGWRGFRGNIIRPVPSTGERKWGE